MIQQNDKDSECRFSTTNKSNLDLSFKKRGLTYVRCLEAQLAQFFFFYEGGNYKTRRKPFKSEHDRLQASPRTRIITWEASVVDDHYISLSAQGVQQRFFPDGHHISTYQLCPTGLNFIEQTGTCVSLLVQTVLKEALKEQFKYSFTNINFRTACCTGHQAKTGK